MMHKLKPFTCGGSCTRCELWLIVPLLRRDVDELRHDEETLRKFEAEPLESTVHGKEVSRERWLFMVVCYP